MSFAAAAQALPMLLGGGGGSTEVSTSNSQSFSGSLAPTFNINYGGPQTANPYFGQRSDAAANAVATGDPSSNPLGGLGALGAGVGGGGYSDYPASYATAGSGDFTNILIMAGLGFAAYMILQKKG